MAKYIASNIWPRGIATPVNATLHSLMDIQTVTLPAQSCFDPTFKHLTVQYNNNEVSWGQPCPFTHTLLFRKSQLENVGLGNTAAHIKYGNRMEPADSNPPEIRKPLDSLCRKGLSIAHLNINGLTHCNRVDQLQVHLLNRPLDILCISETKCNENIPHDDIMIDGYDVHRRDRLTDGGGGVAVYIKRSPSLIFKQRNDLMTAEIEGLVGEVILPNSKPLILGAVYRPPNSRKSWINQFESMVDIITLENKETLFLGDFNVDLLKNEKHLQYLEEVYQFEQLIHEPTRVTKDSSTLIDHIYTTNTEHIRTSGVTPLEISDHHMIYLTRKFKQPKTFHRHIEINYRSYKTFNENAFRQDLELAPWSVLDMEDDPNDAWTTWRTLYNEVLDQHAPLKTRRIKSNSAPWINDSILTAMQHRDETHEQARRFNTSELWTAYRDARNNVGNIVRQAKAEYYKEIVEQNVFDSKALWKSLKVILPGKVKAAALSFIINGTMETNPKSIAQAFNDFFCKS